MPVGNFDDFLPVPAAGDGVNARGPLTLQPGEVVHHLTVWVYQVKKDGTGAGSVGKTTSFPANDHWETSTSRIGDQDFEEGPAEGMAMAVWTSNGKKQAFWWIDKFSLGEPRSAT
jgi:hypothetical protein